MPSNLGGGSLGQAALPSPFARTAFIEEESKADRRRRKDAERLLETRLLDPWERYRALSDHVDHLLDVTELADRKTRFALVILGALNAVNLLIAIRAPQLGADALNPAMLQSYITGYVLLSLYAAVFAILALRPRSQEMDGAAAQSEPTGMSLLAGTPEHRRRGVLRHLAAGRAEPGEPGAGHAVAPAGTRQHREVPGAPPRVSGPAGAGGLDGGSGHLHRAPRDGIVRPFPRHNAAGMSIVQSDEDAKAERKRRKDEERFTETRPLDPWERYRALSDHVDHLLDVTELADRKTRFALVILGALNAVNVLIAIRAPQIDADGLNHTFIQVYVAGYVLISLYFFVYAIMALRPRVGRMHRIGEARPHGGLPGLRLMDDILATDIDDYYELWRTAEVGQLDREMALQAYLLARANAEKFRAVRRVFQGLLLLVGLTALLVAIIGLHVMAPATLGI